MTPVTTATRTEALQNSQSRDMVQTGVWAGLLGEGPAVLLLRQPCLGGVALRPCGGGWAQWESIFGAFVLWRLSLAAFHISSTSQSRRDHFQASASEQRDRSLFFSVLSRPHRLHFCPCCYKLQCPGLCAPPQRPQSCLQSGHISALCASKTTRCSQFVGAGLRCSGFPPQGLQFTSATPAHWVSVSEAAVYVRTTLSIWVSTPGAAVHQYDPGALGFHLGGCSSRACDSRSGFLSGGLQFVYARPHRSGFPPWGLP